MALGPGSRLGPYEITAKIGEGGMGEVWRARDMKLDRDVAIKILPEAVAADPERLARFEREAKTLAALNHPNIAHIYGLEGQVGQAGQVGRSSDAPCLVMELVEGEDLSERIARGPIPVHEALPIAKQITEALEAAHEHGIIHRDLKPANVKVREDGTVKVLDFGLAKALERPGGAGESGGRGGLLTQSPTITTPAPFDLHSGRPEQGRGPMTAAGIILGSAGYMSPEQARGKSVDRRADIWAFGCVLFEMLTGTRAFEDEDVSMTLSKVLQREPSWEAVPATVPDRVARVVRLCLQKDLKRRVADVHDVRLALEGAFETRTAAHADSAVAAPVQTVWQRPVAMAVAMMASLAVGGLAVWAVTRPTSGLPDLVTRFPIRLAAGQTFSGVGEHLVAISPNGASIVYSANGSLWLRSVDQLRAVQVRGTEGASGPFFSPDGRWIGFSVDGQLKKVAVSGGAPVTLADVGASPQGPSWGADDMILYGQPDGIMSVAGAGSTPELLLSVEADETILSPQMLPGGEWVLFTVLGTGHASWDEAQIVVQSPMTGERLVLIEGGRDGRYVASGYLVYCRNGVLFAVPFEAASRQVSGPRDAIAIRHARNCGLCVARMIAFLREPRPHRHWCTGARRLAWSGDSRHRHW